MNLQKKRSRAAVHEEPYIANHSKKQRLNQYSKAGFMDSPSRPLGHNHSPSFIHDYPNESDVITPMNRDPQLHYPDHSASVGFSGRVESAQIELQQNQNPSFFPSSSDFKVVDSYFNSFRDHISTNNVFINMNTGSSASNNKPEVPLFETKSSKQPMQNVHPVVRKSSEVYYRHLLTLGRGSPLWIPEPSTSLPVEYQKAGIGIGDVGILKDSGGFDFLFNVYLPQNDVKHPINPRTMPDGFRPLDAPEERDVNGHAEFKNQSFLTSSHVDSRPYKSLGFIFESSAADGAILTMPNGANSLDLDNMTIVRKYISMNIKQWYTYANEVRGRDARNGDLRLVIGKTSATTWGMATFSKNLEDQEISRLKFKPTRFGHIGNSSRPNYRWEYCGKAEVKSGPDEHEIEQLRRFDRLKGEEGQMAYENQCLFVRTINVTLQDGLHHSNNIEESHFKEFDRDEVPPVPSGPRSGRSWKENSQKYRDNDEGKNDEDFVVPLQAIAQSNYDSHPGFPPFDSSRSYIDPAFWPTTGTEPEFPDLEGQSGALPPGFASIPITDRRSGDLFKRRRRVSGPTRDPVLHPGETGWRSHGGRARAQEVSPVAQTFQSFDDEDDVPEAWRTQIPASSSRRTFEPGWSSVGQTGDRHPPTNSIKNAARSQGGLDGARESEVHKITQNVDQRVRTPVPHSIRGLPLRKTRNTALIRGRSQLARGYPSEYLPPEKNLPVETTFHSSPLSFRASASSPTMDPVSYPETTGMSDHGGSSRASPFTQTVPPVDTSQFSGDDGPEALRFRITPASSNPPVSSSLPAADEYSHSDSTESPVIRSHEGAPPSVFTMPPVDASQSSEDNAILWLGGLARRVGRRRQVSLARPSSPTREPVVENETDMGFQPNDWDESIPVLGFPASERMNMNMGARAPLAQSSPRTRRTSALQSFNERSPSPSSPPSPRAHDYSLGFYPTESDYGGPSGVLPPIRAVIPIDLSLAEDFSISLRGSASTPSPTNNPVLHPEGTGLEDHRGGGTSDQTGDPPFDPTEIGMPDHRVAIPKKTELRNYSSSSSASPTAMAYQDDQMSQPHGLSISNPFKSEAPLAAELHPSKIINEYLLNRVPEATMAITEDGDWISVLQTTDTVFPADEVLLSRIKDKYDVCVEEGVVFLRSRT